MNFITTGVVLTICLFYINPSVYVKDTRFLKKSKIFLKEFISKIPASSKKNRSDVESRKINKKCVSSLWEKQKNFFINLLIFFCELTSFEEKAIYLFTSASFNCERRVFFISAFSCLFISNLCKSLMIFFFHLLFLYLSLSQRE